MRLNTRLVIAGLCAGAIAAANGVAVVAGQASPQSSPAWNLLQWRHIGPVGNRITSVMGIAGEPDIYYVGAASGGVWKTTDAGLTWEPLFDRQSSQAIGALAVADSDPNVVWAGTGEAMIRSNVVVGDGIYRSTDAGRTWTRMGLEQSGRIARILVHPQDPDVVLVCALGHGYGPQQERGVFRTADGGATWNRVLFTDEQTGCSDLAFNPRNPRTVYAGMWPLLIRPWGRTSGGPGSGVFKSTDGGQTFTRLTGSGLPRRETGKVALAVARSNPDRVYALIETGDGVPWKGEPTDRGKLWRSDDAGRTWRMVSTDNNLGGRTHYYFRMLVSPSDENEVSFFTAGFAVSLDGGLTHAMRQGSSSPGGDNHDMWIDPADPDRMIVGNDGGVSISVNHGRTWNRVQLPIAQMYHVTVDSQIPYHVIGNRQDGPSFRGPSNSRQQGFGGFGGIIPRSAWTSVGGSESGFSTPDPKDPFTIWSNGTGLGMVGGVVEKFDVRSGSGRQVEIWPESTIGHSAADLRYRFHWTMPLHISPHDSNTIYASSQHVHVTRNGGQSWEVISPDLTLNDRSRMGSSGGLSPDNIGVEYAGVVMAVAESRIERELIWAGTNDGLVHVTRDGGKSWTNVTKNIPALPEWGMVYNIEPSRFDAGTAYVQFDFHQMGRFDPFVYKTTDYGRTWKAITNGITRTMLSYTHCIREDPSRKGLLYLATEGGIYVSWDDGENWQSLQLNLPRAPVYWIAIPEQTNDLVIATYGRGFWVLDDLTPIQQMTERVRTATAYLFPPRPAYRFRGTVTPAAPSVDPTAGQNPPYGASINYWLAAAQPNARVEILDDAGSVVRSLTGTGMPGLNRVTWDLRGETTRRVQLRMPPAFMPDYTMSAEGTRPPPEASQYALLVPPGKYSVRLTAGGQTLSAPLAILKDPNTGGSQTELDEQVGLVRQIQTDLEGVVSAVNAIESVRAQLAQLVRQTEGTPNATAAREAAEPLERALGDVEDRLIQRKVTGQGQDIFRAPVGLMGKLVYLANSLQRSDHRPTDQAREVHTMLRGRAAEARKQLDAIVGGDMKNFNQFLQSRGLTGLIVP